MNELRVIGEPRLNHKVVLVKIVGDMAISLKLI